MRIMCIGDVVGSSGCAFLRQHLHSFKKQQEIDLVICNGENSADGNGITVRSAEHILASGADVITLGNHSFRRKEVFPFLDEFPYIVRPYNYPSRNIPGKGYCVIDLGYTTVGVINLMGQQFMDANMDNPFIAADKILSEIVAKVKIVDFHAEATSEKKAMGHYLTDRVTAIVGTHTHVQTSDEIILGGGTAYITDAGMTGPEISCLGADIGPVINTYRFHMPERFTPSANPCFLCGVVIAFDEKTGKSHKIERIIIR